MFALFQDQKFVVLHKGVKSVIRYEILAKCLQQSIEYDKWYFYVLEKMVLFAVNLPNNKCAEWLPQTKPNNQIQSLRLETNKDLFLKAYVFIV